MLLSTLAQARDLDALLKLSQDKFEAELGPVSSAIKIEIAPEKCLRTGYNRKTKSVVFCPNQRIFNAGLDSVDVIHHEFFHALLCAYRADLCEKNERDDVHEALADAFAYKLNPDSKFGEDYYQDFPYIRKYQTSWRVGLVQGEHERGVALAQEMISSRRPLRDFLELFLVPVKEEVSVEALGQETSKLNRYRLKLGEVLTLQFNFAAQAEVAKLQWSLPSGMSARYIKPFQTELRLNSEISSTKAHVRFLSATGKELGRRSFYFGSKI